MPSVDFVCLANSRKYRGRCIAGLRTDGSGWVRPISAEPYGTLQPAHYRLSDGTEPRLLDVLRVELAAHRPDTNQPENWLIATRQWELVARPAPDGMEAVLASRITNSASLFGSTRDRLTADEYRTNPSIESLTLVRPHNLSWQVRKTQQGNPQVRAHFEVSQRRYNLTLTDMVWEPFITLLGEGLYRPSDVGMPPEGRLVFTVSLGEPTEFDGACYKLVAAVTSWPEPWCVP